MDIPRSQNRTPAVPSAPSSVAMKRLAWSIKLFCLAGALFTLVAPAMFWSHANWVESSMRQMLVSESVILQTDGQSLFYGWLSSWLVGGLRLFALWQVWVLFGCYQRGEVFGLEPVRRLRRFAFALAAHTLAAPLSDTLAVLALTLGNPPGNRVLTLHFAFEHGFSLFFGLLFLAIARVMFEASRVAQENAEFV